MRTRLGYQHTLLQNSVAYIMFVTGLDLESVSLPSKKFSLNIDVMTAKYLI